MIHWAGLLACLVTTAFPTAIGGQWQRLVITMIAYSCGDSFRISRNSLLILSPKGESGTTMWGQS